MKKQQFIQMMREKHWIKITEQDGMTIFTTSDILLKRYIPEDVPPVTEKSVLEQLEFLKYRKGYTLVELSPNDIVDYAGQRCVVTSDTKVLRRVDGLGDMVTFMPPLSCDVEFIQKGSNVEVI